MEHPENIRIDKWLWAVRIYKTRSQATEACKKGRVTIDGIVVKPSRIIKKEEILHVKKLPVIYTFKVKELLHNRVSAKLAPDFIEDLTPQEELIKLKMNSIPGNIHRQKGAGRPTKKERRTLNKLFDPEI